MEEIYELVFHELVVEHDLAKISAKDKRRILSYVDKKLSVNPVHFGKPLRYSLKPHRSLRVGNYRVVFRLSSCRVYILAIFHRKKGYKDLIKRV